MLVATTLLVPQLLLFECSLGFSVKALCLVTLTRGLCKKGRTGACLFFFFFLPSFKINDQSSSVGGVFYNILMT